MKCIDTQLLDDLTAKAVASPRKRAHYNLHAVLEDPVQRLCVAIEPSTYIRPHRHTNPSTWEVFLLLRGSAVLLLFEEQGRVKERTVLAARGPVHAVEIPANAWHSIASLETGSIFLEVKQGPYSAPAGSSSAVWAPAEGEPGTARFEAWYRIALAGEVPPKLR